MNQARLRQICEELANGDLGVEEGLARFRAGSTQDLGHTVLDTQRELRCGHPEVVFGQGKRPEEVVEIARALLERHDRLLVTRLGDEGAKALCAAEPRVRWHPRSRCATVAPADAPPGVGRVLVLSAGTSDAAVAEEAAITARMHGAHVEELRDVGVAGLHRLLAHAESLHTANALVVVAGMEGALPSVVGGLVDRPVIAVPTSVGYGASLGGLAALLAMLNSCAAGVTVVNIDNGFGAGCAAARINRLGCPP
ncbi:MAG TPA: nickel pincer cofactor biosynthesis protein LarB [Planctomycetota bacterium]|nr:nickel pincer cofactor biosynthesis protein LarB [Planctomycetota bacterium]